MARRIVGNGGHSGAKRPNTEESKFEQILWLWCVFILEIGFTRIYIIFVTHTVSIVQRKYAKVTLKGVSESMKTITAKEYSKEPI